jgi:hypothetical protein
MVCASMVSATANTDFPVPIVLRMTAATDASNTEFALNLPAFVIEDGWELIVPCVVVLMVALKPATVMMESVCATPVTPV